MLKLKNRHYLNFEGHFYLCVQRKTNASLDVYGRFWKFQVVSQSCNMLQLGVERCGSVSVRSADRFYLNMTKLH